jgi:hypothetical protein
MNNKQVTKLMIEIAKEILPIDYREVEVMGDLECERCGFVIWGYYYKKDKKDLQDDKIETMNLYSVWAHECEGSKGIKKNEIIDIFFKSQVIN